MEGVLRRVVFDRVHKVAAGGEPPAAHVGGGPQNKQSYNKSSLFLHPRRREHARLQNINKGKGRGIEFIIF